MVRESKLVPACSTETTKIVIMTKGVQRLGLGDCFFIVVRVMFVCVCVVVVHYPLIVTGESQNGEFDGAVIPIGWGLSPRRNMAKQSNDTSARGNRNETEEGVLLIFKVGNKGRG